MISSYATTRLTSTVTSSLAIPKSVKEENSDDDEEEEYDDESLALSHTIIVVDNSGSMRTRDVAAGNLTMAALSEKHKAEANKKKRRCEALTDVIVNIILEGQRKDGANERDLFSIIRMQDSTAEHVFVREPFPAVHAQARDKLKKQPSGEGFYLPALNKVAKIAAQGACALLPTACTQVLFLSDGQPSDQIEKGWNDRLQWTERCLIPQVRDAVDDTWIAVGKDRRRLKWHCIGLGDAQDFTVLRRWPTRVRCRQASAPSR